MDGKSMIEEIERELKYHRDELDSISYEINTERIAALVKYVRAAEYGFKMRGEFGCKHEHPAPDDICAQCKMNAARKALGLKTA